MADHRRQEISLPFSPLKVDKEKLEADLQQALDKNKAGRALKRIGEGIKEDVIERKKEYLSAMTDIGGDIVKGEIPLDKIAKMTFEGVYNGCSIATNKYIKEKAEKKFENKKLKQEVIKGIGKAVTGTGRDVLFKNESILYYLSVTICVISPSSFTIAVAPALFGNIFNQ